MVDIQQALVPSGHGSLLILAVVARATLCSMAFTARRRIMWLVCVAGEIGITRRVTT